MHHVEYFERPEFIDAVHCLNEQINVLFNLENINLKSTEKTKILELKNKEIKQKDVLQNFVNKFDFTYYYELENYLLIVGDFCDDYYDLSIYIFDLNLDIKEENAKVKILSEYYIELTKIFMYCLIKKIDITNFEKTKQNIEDLIKYFKNE